MPVDDVAVVVNTVRHVPVNLVVPQPPGTTGGILLSASNSTVPVPKFEAAVSIVLPTLARRWPETAGNVQAATSPARLITGTSGAGVTASNVPWTIAGTALSVVAIGALRDTSVITGT